MNECICALNVYLQTSLHPSSAARAIYLAWHAPPRTDARPVEHPLRPSPCLQQSYIRDTDERRNKKCIDIEETVSFVSTKR